ncbi:MAG: thiosulfate oxidation carrier protein SoxY [Gammaproteobacteria bacterium]|jgi:sulfur-oxidizing protein SoxY
MNTNMKRRLFLKASVAAGTVGVAASAGLLMPRTVLAAWNEAAFKADTLAAALKAGMGSDAATESAGVTLEVPPNPENGAVVPVAVSTTLSGVQSIAILVEKNASPLCGVFYPGKRMKPAISIRVKVGESGEIITVVKSGDKLHSARQAVKVTVGGCG